MQAVKIYIYGYGLEYNRLSSHLAAYGDFFEILGIVSTYPGKIKRIDGFDIQRIEDVDLSECDYIILTSKKYWREMYKKCLECGIGEEKIIQGSVFELPWFDFNEYIKVKMAKPTIFSNFCSAGVIYRELGLKFFSPTINMICEGSYFLKFLENYQKYLQMDMEMYDSGCEDASMYKIKNNCVRFAPKGIINNEIVWNFVHEQDPVQEILNWNIRRKRVNYENINIVMIIQSDEEAYRFDELPFKNKIGLYYKDLKLDSVIKIDGWDNPEIRRGVAYMWHVHAINLTSNTRGWVNRIDWIKFLNRDTQFIRY